MDDSGKWREEGVLKQHREHFRENLCRMLAAGGVRRWGQGSEFRQPGEPG